MKKIKWCFAQKRGLEFVDINDNLSVEYMNEADDTLENMMNAKGKWKVIMAYYACYNALYSILMKIGVKSEIHDCSIALMEHLGFDDDDVVFIDSLKSDRIDAQYYLKDVDLKDEEKVKGFVMKCKTLSAEVAVDTIKEKIKEVSK